MELTARWTMTLVVELAHGLPLGSTPGGVTTVIPITGGTVEGEGWRGHILPGGADWNTVGGGLTEFSARYSFVTEAGQLVTVINRGITPSDFDLSLVKTHLTFLVGDKTPLDHLHHGIHVGTVDVSELPRGRVTIGVYRLP